MDANEFKKMAEQIGKNDMPGELGSVGIGSDIIDSARKNSDSTKKMLSIVANLNESMGMTTNPYLKDDAVETFTKAKELLDRSNTWCKDQNIIKASPKLASAMQLIVDSISK